MATYIILRYPETHQRPSLLLHHSISHSFEQVAGWMQKVSIPAFYQYRPERVLVEEAKGSIERGMDGAWDIEAQFSTPS